MTCQSCNQTIPDDSVFCELCGAKQSSPAGQAAPVSQAAVAAAQSVRVSVQSFWSPLGIANKIAFSGCIAVVVGFFMPWIDISMEDIGALFGRENIGKAFANPSISGFTAAKDWGVIYVFPALAITAAVLLYLAVQKHRTASRILYVSSWLVIIGSLFGPQLLLCLIFVPAMQKICGVGFWLNTLGFCAIAVAGMMNIRSLSRNLV